MNPETLKVALFQSLREAQALQSHLKNGGIAASIKEGRVPNEIKPSETIIQYSLTVQDEDFERAVILTEPYLEKIAKRKPYIETDPEEIAHERASKKHKENLEKSYSYLGLGILLVIIMAGIYWYFKFQ